MSFYKLSNDTLVSAISILVKKIFTKIRSDVHYFLTDFRMNSYGKAVNLDINKLQGNHSKGSCIIEFYCLECKGKDFSDIKIILNDISLKDVILDGFNCKLFDDDSNFNDAYEYESVKEDTYDYLFNKSEDEDGYISFGDNYSSDD